MGEVIQFPLHDAPGHDLAADFVMLSGDRVGIHLTDDSELAIFVEHQGLPVGGLLTLEQALELRAALTGMLAAGGYPSNPGSAA